VSFRQLMSRSKLRNYLSDLDMRSRTLALEAERTVALLKERRSALISAAVTGQIDVRGLAPEQEQAA
jgi:type I restriction enzyme S subunit